MLVRIPNHLRPRRAKIFGPAPSHPMDGNAKARFWAHLKGYNRTHRQKGQHIGPYTRTMLDVIQTMLFGFHNADGTGRCFPSYKTIAKVANCSDDSVERAINTAEMHGHLTWVHPDRAGMARGARPAARRYAPRQADEPDLERLSFFRPARTRTRQERL
jgi:hypothetical protein